MKTPTREDYELAAKAAGLELLLDSIDGFSTDTDGPFGKYRQKWNPYNDDGDSRRLENAIGPDVVRTEERINVYQVNGDIPRPTDLHVFEDYADHNGDKDAATRAAVFWLAVEIGRSI
jgi:hypothetical protein